MIKHGMSKTLAYRSWATMKGRCLNPTYINWDYYGGRGIKVCKRWMKFENFYEDMGERPKGMSLERINNNGNYNPSNCKWATRREQMSNRKNNVGFNYKGVSRILPEWARILNINRITLYRRIHLGWSIERAFEAPIAYRTYK